MGKSELGDEITWVFSAEIDYILKDVSFLALLVNRVRSIRHVLPKEYERRSNQD